MKFQLKFHDSAEQQDMDATLSKAMASGVTRVRRYAAKHPVPAFRRMYSLEVPNDRDEVRVFKLLKRQPTVEYVEREADRKLVMPVRSGTTRRALGQSKAG